MRTQFSRWVIEGALIVAGVSFVLTWTSAAQQSQPGAATIPRTPDGKPNLSGIWQTMNTANWDILDHNASLGVPAGQSVVEGGVIPYQPWAGEKHQENYVNRAELDPLNQCYLPGVPRATYMPFPFEIVQRPNYVAILYEYVHGARIIHTNGTRHPDGMLFWMGDSRGHWEGDTLVVDVTNLDEQTWFDKSGNFHSEELHVVERYTPIDTNLIQYEATIEDPQVFTRPWKMSMLLYRHREENFQLLEYECYAYAEEELRKAQAPKSTR